MSFETLKAAFRDADIDFCENESMKEYTTFKIGGNADLMAFVKDEKELCLCVKFAKEFGVPYFVLGKGSNLLVSDKGIEGVVINTCKAEEIKVFGNKIECSAGVTVAKLCLTAAESGLSGLEFAYGIPGSVGGALYMNAGAYGGEISQTVVSAEYLDADGNVKTVLKPDMGLGYRKSVFKDKGLVILKVTFQLDSDLKANINSRMNGFLSKRKEKQPLTFPSAGSVFKRPEGHFAGALIEKNGLKGKTVGGAQVSEKHAGFIVNLGNATADDVTELIKFIQDTVKREDGVQLEEEVIFVGRK